MKSRVYKICVVLLLPILIVGCQPTKPDESLRVVTYNTYLVSPPFRCLEGVDLLLLGVSWGATLIGGPAALAVALAISMVEAVALVECMAEAGDIAPADAEVIASRMLATADDFDVIAFNEVFDEDAKDVLVARLSPTYPHFVRYIDDSLMPEDSGLMLFSRFPFAPLPKTEFQIGADATTDQVAFIRYEACAVEDCLAGKGAALVRIDLPGTARMVTVVFTHMQAAYNNSQEHADERQAQFRDIIRLIDGTLNDPLQERVVIMGDLNIEGSGGLWDIPSMNALNGAGEWLNIMENDARDADLLDVWAGIIPDGDQGITHPADSQRLDYIMGNLMTVMEIGCVQHMTNRVLGHSDHIAVTGDLNLPSEYCHPRIAWTNPPLDTLLDEQTPSAGDSTEIRHPGSMQWFHVKLDTASTVSVGVYPPFDANSGSGVDFELYAPHNFSVPIPPYLKEQGYLPNNRDLVGKKFIAPTEFYIRVFSPNRSWTGNYTIGIHQHKCQSQQDHCLLPVNDPRTYDTLFKPGQAVGADDAAWFQIDVTDVADSGNPQGLRVFADSFASEGLLNVELVEKANPAQGLTLNNEVINTSPTSVEITGQEVGPISMFMIVRRSDENQGSGLRVGWESNLTRLHGANLNLPDAEEMRLICQDETNGFLGSEAGEDEIHLLINVDGMGFNEVFAADYDCNNTPMPKILDSAVGVIRFLDNVQIKIVEEDDGSPNDSGPTSTITVLPINAFPPSDTLAPGVADVRVANNHFIWNFEGGEYRFEFNLSHQIFPQ